MVNTVKRELTLTRIFDAPRDAVFKMWTKPELISTWWGPKGVTTPVCEFDGKVGGNINIVMLAGEELGNVKGTRWPMTGTIREIRVPEKLVFTATAINNDKPFLEHMTTVTFEDIGGKTKMVLHIEVTKALPGSEAALTGMETGWNQSLDKLAVIAPSQAI